MHRSARRSCGSAVRTQVIDKSTIALSVLRLIAVIPGAMAMDAMPADGGSAAATAAANERTALRRCVLPDDLYGSVAEHLQPARVALMLHRRARELTDGSWHRR